MATLIDQMRQTESALKTTKDENLAVIYDALHEGVQALAESTDWILQHVTKEPNAAMSGSVNYLMLTGYVCGGWQMARAALVVREKLASGDNPTFNQAKLLTARFYVEQILPKTSALQKAITSGATTIMALTEEQF